MGYMEDALFNIFDESVINAERTGKINLVEPLRFLSMFYKNKYFKGLNVSDTIPLDGSLAAFVPSEKNIYVYINSIVDRVQSNCLSKKETFIMLYYELIRSLLHEIEHSKQYTLHDSIFKNSLEKDILNFTILNLSKKLSKFTLDILYKELGRKPNMAEIELKYLQLMDEWYRIYQENYLLVPMERLADFKSYATLEKMFKGKEEYKLNFEFSNTCKLKTLLVGYKVENDLVVAPTTTFIEKLQQSSFKRNTTFDWYSSDKKECLERCFNLYEFRDRIKYGLPITMDEYNKFEEKTLEKQKVLEKKYGILIEDKRK